MRKKVSNGHGLCKAFVFYLGVCSLNIEENLHKLGGQNGLKKLKNELKLTLVIV